MINRNLYNPQTDIKPYLNSNSSQTFICPAITSEFGLSPFIGDLPTFDPSTGLVAVWDMSMFNNWTGPLPGRGPISTSIEHMLNVEGVMPSRSIINPDMNHKQDTNIRNLSQLSSSGTKLLNERYLGGILKDETLKKIVSQFILPRIKLVKYHQDIVRVGSIEDIGRVWWMVFSPTNSGISNGNPAIPIDLSSSFVYESRFDQFREATKVRNVSK